MKKKAVKPISPRGVSEKDAEKILFKTLRKLGLV